MQGNPRVYKALKNQLHEVLTELQRIEGGAGVEADMMETIKMIAVIMNGMKNETYDT